MLMRAEDGMPVPEGDRGDAVRLLDNPIWSALTTGHAHLALGGAAARRYPEEIGPLSGMAEGAGEAGFDALAQLTEPGEVVVLFCHEAQQVPSGWALVRDGALDQMTAVRPSMVATSLPEGAPMRALTPADAPAMVELARLTEPGPFRLRTLELGGYCGIFHGDRLMAMAGRRLAMPGFVEVSAVCTHPEARGRGYARMLMSQAMEGIIAEGRTPFLHTFAENAGAIRIYRELGFTRRRSFALAVLRRGEGRG